MASAKGALLASTVRNRAGTASLNYLLGASKRCCGIIPTGWQGHGGNFIPIGMKGLLPPSRHPPCTETLFTKPLGLVKLATGAPCEYLLKRSQATIADGIASWASRDRSHLSMQYGPVGGTLIFRNDLAAFLTRHYNESVNPSRLVQPNGATHGLSQLLSTFFGKSAAKVAFLEDPTYFLAPKVFKQHGFQVVPVAMSPSGACNPGLDLDALEATVEAKLKDHGDVDARFRGVVYCVPTFHNPSGVTMSDTSRERLVAIARKHQLLVVTDDVYDLISYPGMAAPPKRVISYDLRAKNGKGCVISNGTFSKILSPGVRTGWIEAAPDLVESLVSGATSCSSGTNSQLMGAVLSELMRSGVQDEILQEIRVLYAERMQVLQKNLHELLPGDFKLTVPRGGMCAWLTMPESVDSHEVLMGARRRGVSFKPGDWFSSSGAGGYRNSCRLVVAHSDKAEIAEACRILAEVIRLQDRPISSSFQEEGYGFAGFAFPSRHSGKFSWRCRALRRVK